MTREVNNDLTRYLLGEASEAECMQLEEKFFTDDELYAQLLGAENDLIDSYVHGRLPASTQAQFEKRFLATPRRRQKVKFAQSLKRATQVAQAQGETASIATTKRVIDYSGISLWYKLRDLFNGKHPKLTFGALTAVLLVLLGGAGLLSVWQRGESTQVAQAPAEPTPDSSSISNQDSSEPTIETTSNASVRQAEPEAIEKSKLGESTTKQTPRAGRSPAQQPRPSVATFVLTPGLLRSSGKQNNLNLTSPTDAVRLQLDLAANDYPTYRAVLQTPDGDEVWSARGLKSQAVRDRRTVIVRVPAELLKRGDYNLTLGGETADGSVEVINEYALSITTK